MEQINSETSPFSQDQTRAEDAENIFSMGTTLEQQGKRTEALEHYQHAVSIDPAHAKSYFKMGIIYKAMNQPESALACYQKAARILPASSNIFFNMANICHDLGRMDDARVLYQKVIELNPDDAEALHHLGNVLKTMDRLEEALDVYLKAIRLNPESAVLYVDLGEIYYKQEKYKEAFACCKKALSLDPNQEDAHHNMGITLEALGRFHDALAAYHRVLRINPRHKDAAWNHTLTHLLLGDFKEGWRGYENRIDPSNWHNRYPYRQGLPKWGGEALEGKILYIHEEQGIGDTFQFIRYLPLVKALGGTVVFETSRNLSGLLQGVEGIDTLVERRSDGRCDIPCDCYIPLLSLPGMFETTEQNLPCRIPYLFADKQKTQYWQEKLKGPGFKVGIVWRGNPRHKKDHTRSCPLAAFTSLGDLQGVRFFGIQKNDFLNEMEQVPDNPLEQNLGEYLKDFTDTAGLIANLDLIISVDTSVAHLAGAMGRPVWVLIPFVPDWRWMLERTDTPWYPTMRLFRQPRPGDWDAVIRQVIAEIRRHRPGSLPGPSALMEKQNG